MSYREIVELGRSSDRTVVIVERLSDEIALVRLDEPESLNPLSPALTLQLHDRLEDLCADLTVRAVILTGTDPAFSAGGDLRSMRDVVHPAVDGSPEGATVMWRWIRREFSGIARLIARTDKLFVAAVNGPVAGVGLAFAQACDLVIASERAQLVLAFAGVGLIPRWASAGRSPAASVTTRRSSCSSRDANSTPPRRSISVWSMRSSATTSSSLAPANGASERWPCHRMRSR